MFERLDEFIKDELDICEKRIRKARADFELDDMHHWRGYHQCLVKINSLLKKEDLKNE